FRQYGRVWGAGRGLIRRRPALCLQAAYHCDYTLYDIMAVWTVELLDDVVAEELGVWPVELRAALTRIIERITSLGLERVGEPHLRHIEGKLREMRASGIRLEGRALYIAATGRRVVIVLAFLKKTRKTPDRLIRLALERARRVKS